MAAAHLLVARQAVMLRLRGPGAQALTGEMAQCLEELTLLCAPLREYRALDSELQAVTAWVRGGDMALYGG